VEGKTVKVATSEAGGEAGAAAAAAEPQAQKKKKSKDKAAPAAAAAAAAAAGGGGAASGGGDLAAVQAWRDEKNVQASEEVLPTLAFSDPRLPKNVVQASCKGFQAPTPIQAQCWPILLAGRDMIGLAETGSGKTLAFTLPGLKDILDRWDGKPPKKQMPMMLVVAPTRELALQSCAVAEAAAKGVGVNACCLYGGVPKWEQKALINAGISVVIATPGRLRDLSEEGSVDLSQVTRARERERERGGGNGMTRVRVRICSQDKRRKREKEDKPIRLFF
jgi:ATP-dependent RNA helicase DBP3